MDRNIKQYADTLYEQSRSESSRKVAQDRTDFAHGMALRRRTTPLPISGPEIQALTKLFAQHVERCMEERFKSYETAYGEVGQNPTDAEFHEIFTSVENAQKSESQNCVHALSNFVQTQGQIRNLPFNLSAPTAHGHDRVLKKLKVWQARVRLTNPESRTRSNAQIIHPPTPFRFLVALSFPGEKRRRVSRIAEMLASTLGKQRILYDEWHRAEFARPNLDVYLPNLYREQSLLIVFFLCSDYDRKQWCGLEWRAGRDLLKNNEDHRLMFLRLDRAEIKGLYSIDGYLDISNMPDELVAGEVLKRLEQTRTSFTLSSEAHEESPNNTSTAAFPASNTQPLDLRVVPSVDDSGQITDRLLSNTGRDLDPKEVELLRNAARDANGEILFTRTFDGESIGTNGRQFLKDADARSGAEWVAAFRSLRSRGLVEPLSYDSAIFRVTANGYREADELEGFARWDVKSVELRAGYVNTPDDRITLTCTHIVAIPPRYFEDQIGADRSVQRSLKEPRTLLVEGVGSPPTFAWNPTELEFEDGSNGQAHTFRVAGMEFVRPNSLKFLIAEKH